MIEKVFQKVYIIRLEACSQPPEIGADTLSDLGYWYVSTGKEWVCHSEWPLETFQTLFLNLLPESERPLVHFEEDFLPFGQS